MLDRAAALAELSRRKFDVLIIGGGITGAGIARDAAMRGLSVALVEKSDFASGTSSRSSRLIHGGLRYLEHGRLRLVFEASAERRRLLRIAPHLVRPLAFTWPVYSGQRLPLWKVSAGLKLYDMLSLFSNVQRHERLTPEQLLTEEPHLRATDLRGALRYFDAATDDARLTLANVVDATANGAVALNHVVLRSISRTSEGRVASVEDALTGNRIDVRARAIVNATGPWSDSVLASGSAVPRRRVRGSKGAHIAVARHRVGNRDAVALLHPRDGRVMFALPARSHAVIGTTDTFTTASPDEISASESDIAYLLEAANTFFPDARLSRADVVSAWAGIRPLLPSDTSEAAASREHAIGQADGVVTITGGKLTTYRVMALQVVDVVQRALDLVVRRPATGARALPGGDIDDIEQVVKDAHASTGDIQRATHLVHSYGTSWRDVHALCDAAPESRARIDEMLPYCVGEARWAVEHELACTLGDFLIRRTHLAFETRDNGRSAARRVVAFLAPLVGWDAPARERELARYDAEVTRIFSITPQ